MQENQVKINLISTLRGYSLSFLPRYLPGSIWGYLSRSEWLTQQFSIPFKYSNAISVVEIGATITANLLVAFIWLSINPIF